MFLGGSEQAGSETGGVQRRPEAIAGPGKVIAGVTGVEAGIDPAKQDAQAGGYYVGDGLAGGSQQVGFGGFKGATHRASSDR